NIECLQHSLLLLTLKQGLEFKADYFATFPITLSLPRIISQLHVGDQFVLRAQAMRHRPALRASLPHCSPKTPLMVERCAMGAKVSTKDAVERMSAATTEAANGIQHSYAVGLKGVQDYNKKWMEFAQTNTQAAMEFYQKLSGAKSPSEFIELSTTNAQRQ